MTRVGLQKDLKLKLLEYRLEHDVAGPLSNGTKVECIRQVPTSTESTADN